MSEILKSFTYDPARQGVDTNSWCVISGAPALATTGRIDVYTGSGESSNMMHYSDVVKGDISLNVNVPRTPTSGDFRLFGMQSPDTKSYVRFSITDSLNCQTSNNGESTISDDLEWSSDWTSADIDFSFVWQSGFVKFFINGVNVYTVADASVPYGPLSFFLADDSATTMSVGPMVVRGAQSIIVNAKSADTIITEVTDVSTSPSASPSLSHSASISPSVSPSESLSPSISPSVSPSESLSPSISPSVSPSESLSPSISPSVSPSESLSPSISPSTSSSISPSISPSVSPSSSVSPSVSTSISPSISPSESPSLG